MAPHDRVVIEDSGRPILTREHPALIRQVHSRRVDQIDDGAALPHRDFLRAENLADCLGPPRPGLHPRVIRPHYHGTSAAPAHARPHTAPRCPALRLVPGEEAPELAP